MITLFEDYSLEKWWMIPSHTNLVYAVALFKVGVPIQEIDSFLHDKDLDEADQEKHIEYILIFKRVDGTYVYDLYDDETLKEYKQDKKLKYMGEVEVTEEDMKRYEMAKEADKYNL